MNSTSGSSSNIEFGLVRNGGELAIGSRPESEISDSERLRLLATQNLSNSGGTWANHVGAVIPVQTISRIMHYHEIYQHILDVPGVVCEFGVQFGASFIQLLNCRNFYEPHNISRVFYGFDTFEGLTGVNAKDGRIALEGDYGTGVNYINTLLELIRIHEGFQPKPYLRRAHLVQGDVTKTIKSWANDNPHAVLSLAVFDLDIYHPTKEVLEVVLPRCARGSVLVFDEFNHPGFPGETLAISEVLGISVTRFRKTRWQPYSAYVVID